MTVHIESATLLQASNRENLIGRRNSESSLWSRRRSKTFGNKLGIMSVETFDRRLSDPAPLGSVSEKYELKDILGHGTMATVHRALVRGEPGKQVALKVLKCPDDPETMQRAKSEFELLQRIPPHPHVIRALEFHELTGGGSVLALELFEGWTLQDATKCSPDRRFPQSALHLIIPALFKAVAHLHKHQVLHRDIKPQNIFISPCYCDLRLADFNVARDLSGGESLTPAGDPIYRAPEVLLGEACSESSDVWSSGLCVFFALYGAMPQQRRESMHDLAFSPVHLPATDQISKTFRASLRRALNLEAAQRPRAVELASDSAWRNK